MQQPHDNIVNLIFFIRGVEPRFSMDLLGTMERQLELVAHHGLKATFLLQYDALKDPAFISALQEKLPPNCEVGGWLEIVQPLVERVGLPWRGRYSWDWHSDVGFSVGYTPEERKQLIDGFMEGFKETLGVYPRSVGSWMIDAVTLDYLATEYGVEASCNCRDQWGTDGYTLWGGYYGQAFYPSKVNALCPAQAADNQISLPVFRMLGSDPIYQYDLGLSTKDGKLCPSDCQHVVTLEPVYYGTGGGGDPRWVDWYLQENFAPGVGFNYTQAGQENSFGWEKMKTGLEYQCCKLAELEKAGALRVETLLESGRWFKTHFPVTPPTSIGAMSDWKDEGRRTLWYESRFYRANFYQENGQVWLRDIYKFDETYPERYLTERCTSHQMVYDNLPVIDGNRWSGGITRAGLYPVVRDEAGTAHPLTGTLTTEYPADGQALVRVTGEDGVLTVLCTEDRLRFTYTGGGRLALELRDGVGALATVQIEEKRLAYTHNGFDYAVELPRVGDIRRIAEGICLEADGDTVELML